MDNFADVYKRDKAIIDKYLPKEVVARLLGKPDEALKHKFNRLLKRESKVLEELEQMKDNGAPQYQFNAKLEVHQNITDEMNKVLNALGEMGVEISENQLENGF